MSGPSGGIAALVARQRRVQRRRLAVAASAGAIVATASVVLLGLSGWFIAGAALAGGAGAVAAQGFNYLTPSAVIRLLAILRTGARYAERISGHDAALHALARLRPEIFERFAKGGARDVLRVSAGEASSRLVRDVDALQTLFIRLSSPWAAGAGAAAAALLAGLAHPLAGLTTIACMIAAAGTNRLVGERIAAPAGREVQAASGAFRARLSALEAAAAELKAYGLTGWAAAEVDAAAASLDRAMVRLNAAGAWMVVSQTTFAALAAAGAVIAARDASTPLIALGALAAVTGVEAAGALAAALRDDGAAREAVERLDALMPEPKRGIGVEPSYDGLAHGVDGEMSPPARLAILGPSGSGKTMLIERLIGLREPVPGEWRMGGIDAANLDAGAVLSRLSYAAQDLRLLDASVRDNLRLAAPEAPDEVLWAALEDAVLADRVRADPAGLDMAIGANGARLSGGERRRLGLARAYLRPTPWLILDEPTEGLDAATEARVLERLDQRLSDQGQGLIVVSHRKAPVKLCGWVIDLGRPGETRARPACATSMLTA